MACNIRLRWTRIFMGSYNISPLRKFILERVNREALRLHAENAWVKYDYMTESDTWWLAELTHECMNDMRMICSWKWVWKREILRKIITLSWEYQRMWDHLLNMHEWEHEILTDLVTWYMNWISWTELISWTHAVTWEWL